MQMESTNQPKRPGASSTGYEKRAKPTRSELDGEKTKCTRDPELDGYRRKQTNKQATQPARNELAGRRVRHQKPGANSTGSNNVHLKRSGACSTGF